MRLQHGLGFFLQTIKSLLVVAIVGAATHSICLGQPHPYGLGDEAQPAKIAKPYAPEYFSGLEKLVRFGVAVSKDNRECYFAVALNDNGRFREEIRYTQRTEDGTWTKPKPLLSNERTFKYVDPHFSPDDKRLYFIYTKPVDQTKAPKRQKFDIWYVERTAGGQGSAQTNEPAWGEPVNLGEPISTLNADEYFVSLTSNKTVFFGSNRANANNFDLYSARLGKNGQYEKPEPLKGQVNTNKYEADVFVAPDESYLIFSSSGRADGRGQGDLYVSFKDAKGDWSAGKNLGDSVNSKLQEFAPSISRDGKALFFSRGGTLHWVSTSVIDDLRR